MNEIETISSVTTNEIQFDKIPLKALRQKNRLTLSKLLNSPKLLSSDDGLPRDWRGIAYLAGLQNLYGPVITMHNDPMEKVLQLWNDVDKENQTNSFGNLYKFLIAIDRWDVADDIKDDLVEDAKFYLTIKTNDENIVRLNNKSELIVNTISESDSNILTQDDVERSQNGLPPQQYDGFVIFADEDIDFATELIERMENYGLKICVKERDLVGGISFEHEAIMRLISERCNRLIVIVSPAFLQSPANKFFVNFAQALGIEQGRRKIIPCLYQYCVLPSTLSFYFLLNYQRSGRYWNFWDKLRDSIVRTPCETAQIQASPIRAITNTTTIPAEPVQNSDCEMNASCKITNLKVEIPILASPSTNCDKSLAITQTDCTNNDSIYDMSNSYVQLTPKNPPQKWYKKLLSGTTKPTTTPATSCDDNDVKIRTKKKKWFKKKLIAS